MKALRNLLDRQRTLFEHGGRLEKLYPLFEAQDTFLFTPAHVTRAASHIRDAIDLKRMMTIVVISLIPCMFMAMYNTGYQAFLYIKEAGALPLPSWQTTLYQALGLSMVPENFFGCIVYGALFFIPIYAVTLAAGGFWEVLFAIVRKHEVNEGFLVTSALFPLILPPTIPLWQVAIGISFGVVIGKEIFGGTGRNFLNPALTARAFLFFAYPAWISGTILPLRGESDAPAGSGLGVWIAALLPDASSGATALAHVKEMGEYPAGGLAAALPWSWWDAFVGFIPGSMGETSTLCAIIGALFIAVTGVASWRIMVGALLGTVVMATTFNVLVESSTNAAFQMPFWWHMVLGGYAFGIAFMATDPVSGTYTNKGKWIYGFLIGLMIVLIRVVNPAYPESTMLTILFMNMFAPLIDYFVVQANIRRRVARYAA
jgi:Na+-transporting NADH:ubiquinone oxidoreductase subunit B